MRCVRREAPVIVILNALARFVSGRFEEGVRIQWLHRPANYNFVWDSVKTIWIGFAGLRSLHHRQWLWTRSVLFFVQWSFPCLHYWFGHPGFFFLTGLKTPRERTLSPVLSDFRTPDLHKLVQVLVLGSVLPVSCSYSLSFLFQNFSLPFNKYAWITTHNAYAIYGETSLLGVTIVSQKNQEDSITSQLNVCSVSLS